VRFTIRIDEDLRDRSTKTAMSCDLSIESTRGKV
jgi:hypothetical protein